MSGAKETPRQKMIGMMYLVLTALLALQVSNAVLEKFIFMNESLERMATDYEAKNNTTLSGMSAEVAKRNNLPDEVAVLNAAKEVQEKTASVMDDLRKLKDTMVDITGGINEETGELVGAADYDKVSTMMLGPNGKGKELEKMLNDYAKFMITKTGPTHADKFEPLARDAKEIPVFANSPNQKDKRFAELYFENTPTAAGMATISYLETEVMEYERLALKILADSVGASEVAFSDIFPLIRPESRIVAAGGKYTAEMFIAASSASLSPKFYMNGKELPEETLDIGGGVSIKKGRVEFTAKGGSYDKEGRAKRSYEATIEMNGKEYKQTVEYIVARPSIMVASAALSALWKNCGNALNVQVPSLGNNYNPSITCSNATTVKGSSKGSVTIIPKTRGKVVMTVKSSGTMIGTKTFTVKDIPKPSYDLKIPSAAGNIVDGVKAKSFRQVTITAKAEPSFAQDVPKDARYRVREIEVKLIRNGDPRKRQVFKTSKISLTAFAAEARKGDLYVFTIKQTVRVNFQNKTERVPVKNEIYKVLVTQ